MTLVQGEFKKGAKKADKNVEVTVNVCNQHGEILQVEIFESTDFVSLFLAQFNHVFGVVVF